MALVTLKQHKYWPDPWRYGTASGAFQNSTADAVGEGFGVVINAFPIDATIRKFGLMLGTTTTGGTCDWRVETVTSGLPSGTLWATNTNASVVVANADDNVLKVSGALTADATIAAGDTVAFIATVPSGYNGAFQSHSNAWDRPDVMTYHVANTGTWGKLTTPLILYLEDSSGNPVLVDGCFPINARTLTGYNSGSSPANRGNKMTILTKCRCIGIWTYISATNADTKGTLYDNSDTDLGNDTITAVNGTGVVHFYFDPVTLNVGDVVRAIISPTTGTSINSREVTVPSSSYMDGLPGGTSVFLTRGSTGSWTDVSTDRFMCGLILDQEDDGTGVGGPFGTNSGF